MPHQKAIFWGSVCAAALLTCGCEEDQIRQYQAPKAAPMAQPGSGDTRLLAAIVPTGGKTWFYKLVGPADVVSTHRSDLENMVATAKYGPPNPPGVTWETIPRGWTPGKNTQLSVHAFNVGGEGMAKFTLSPLSTNAGSLIDNVNRWRRVDLGLEPITDAELKDFVRESTVNGVQVTWVDMTALAKRPK